MVVPHAAVGRWLCCVGVRAVDIRNPYHPQEVAFYIPALTEKTEKCCVPAAGGGEECIVRWGCIRVNCYDHPHWA